MKAGAGTKETVMKSVVRAAVATLILLVLPASANSACLQIGRIWSWKAVDRKTLIVEDDLHDKFTVGLMGYCPNLPFKLNLEFKAIGGFSGLTCLSRGDEIISRDVGMHYICPITSIAPYTPAMEQADKAAAAAKAAQQGTEH
jgi:hypothetical protein